MPKINRQREDRTELTVPPFPVHRFGYAPLLPPRLQRFCHRRFFPSSPRPEWLPPLAARDRPQSRSRISFSEGNLPCTRCRDKFHCALFDGQILLPHSKSFLLRLPPLMLLSPAPS